MNEITTATTQTAASTPTPTSTEAPVRDALSGVATDERAAERDTPVDDGFDEQTTQADDLGEESTAAPATDDAKIQELAQRYGVDPTNPAVAKMLADLAVTEKRIADKDTHIQNLESGQLDDWAAELEKLRTNFTTEKKPPALPSVKPQQPQQQPANINPQAGPPKYGDIGDNWRTWQDSHTQEVEALQAGDYGKVQEIQEARFRRLMDHMVMPQILQIVENGFTNFKQKELAEVQSSFQQTRQERETKQAADRALKQFTEHAKFGPVIDELFKPETGTIEIRNSDGSVSRYENNAFNRIMKAFPQWLDYIQPGDSPDVQAKKYFDIYGFAVNYHQSTRKTGLSPEKAKELIATGRKQEQRTTEQDRVRRSLNTGSTRVAGAGSGKKPNEWADIGPSSGLPLDSLFSRR